MVAAPYEDAFQEVELTGRFGRYAAMLGSTPSRRCSSRCSRSGHGRSSRASTTFTSTTPASSTATLIAETSSSMATQPCNTCSISGRVHRGRYVHGGPHPRPSSPRQRPLPSPWICLVPIASPNGAFSPSVKAMGAPACFESLGSSAGGTKDASTRMTIRREAMEPLRIRRIASWWPTTAMSISIVFQSKLLCSTAPPPLPRISGNCIDP